jgi:hypothetical protein
MKKHWVINAYKFRYITYAHVCMVHIYLGICILFLHLNGQYMMYIHVAPIDGTSIL